MKKLLSLPIILFLLASPLFVLALEYTPISRLFISTDKDFYFYNQQIEISITGIENKSFKLLIFDPYNTTIYDKNHVTNLEGHFKTYFDIPIWVESGTCKIRVIYIEGNRINYIDRLISLVDTDNLISSTIPFYRIHKGLNFRILRDASLEIENYKGENLKIQFPKATKNIFGIECFKNDMIFIVKLRNYDLGIKIDFNFLFIHKGIKLIVNGSTNSIENFDINFMSRKTLAKTIERISCGNLVFDYGDIIKTKYINYFIDDRLEVQIPKNFVFC